MRTLIEKILKATKNQIHINEFNDLYISHPNFPSMLSVTDSLSQLGVENVAAKVPFKHFEQLPNCFITELDFGSKDFYLITKKDGSKITFENEKGVLKKIDQTLLENHWTGVFIAIDESKNAVQKLNFISKDFKTIGLLIFIFLASGFINNYSFLELFYTMITLIGLIISLKISRNYFQISDEIESKICSLNQNFSCNNIINSKNYSFSKYIEFVDLPILFYSTAFFSQVLSIHSIMFFGIASLISIPLLIYSVYLQGIVLKKWCVLCLAVALLNLLISGLFILNYQELHFVQNQLFQIFILIVAIAFIWFSFKKIIVNVHENEKKLNALLRFKRSEEVFMSLSKDIIDADFFNSLPKLRLGNVNAKNTITLFLSPSCPHCHTAYKEALDLIKKNPEQVNLEIGYNININNLDNPYLDVAKTILSLNNNQKDFKKALEDWHIKNMKLEDWTTKWNIESQFLIENNQLEMQFQWCMKNELNFAPIKIFNGKFIPKNYEINELFYFFER